MRAVIDTNVLVSGLFWRGVPHELLALMRNGTLKLLSSPALLAELEAVISRPKFDTCFARASISRPFILGQMRQLAEIIEPQPLSAPICRDPDDDAVLALAATAQADLIVSGDDDLLALGHYLNIPIITPAQALDRARKH